MVVGCVCVIVHASMCISAQLVPSSIDFLFPQRVSAFSFTAWSFYYEKIHAQKSSLTTLLENASYFLPLLLRMTPSLRMDDPSACVRYDVIGNAHAGGTVR